MRAKAYFVEVDELNGCKPDGKTFCFTCAVRFILQKHEHRVTMSSEVDNNFRTCDQCDCVIPDEIVL